MSLDTTHVALAGEQQLQQMVGNPDPRVSIPAAARLAKMIQERKSQQNQQALSAQPQPTVKDQLQQATAPAPAAPESGIAMAAGGMVQRHFWGGGVGITDDSNANDMTNEDYALAAANAARKQYPGPGQTPSVVDPDAAALVNGLVGQSASMQPHLTGVAAAKALPPKAPAAPPGSGLGHAAASDTLSSGPVTAGKVDAASQDQPDDPTYVDRATELVDKLTPLQSQALTQLTDSKSDEEARYKTLQAAKHNPDKFIDTMNQIVALMHPFTQAHGGGMGNMGSLADGAYALAQTQQGQREQQAREDAQHQTALAGINAGMTQQQIKSLMGNYDVMNKAYTTDDASQAKADALVEKTRVDDATIAQKNAAAAKAARAGAGGTGAKGALTPVAAARIRMGIDAAVDRMKDANGIPLAPEVAENIRQQRYSAVGLPGVESAAPASAPGASPGWGQIQRH